MTVSWRNQSEEEHQQPAANQDDLHDQFWSQPTADEHGDADANKEQMKQSGLSVVVLHGHPLNPKLHLRDSEAFNRLLFG
jgi:basic membrane lipoprotein Med (substrate-binding protein (PBP1-ABC) superfamily)